LLIIGFAEFQLIEPLLHFFKSQEQSAVLAEQLPAEPSAGQDDEPRE